MLESLLSNIFALVIHAAKEAVKDVMNALLSLKKTGAGGRGVARTGDPASVTSLRDML